MDRQVSLQLDFVQEKCVLSKPNATYSTLCSQCKPTNSLLLETHCKTSPRHAVSPQRSRTETPEGIFHCLRIFSLSSQTAQHSISKDLNIIMVQLVTLYCAVTAGYETALFAKQGTGTITLSQTRALRQRSTNVSFLTGDTSISPTQICNAD